MPTNDKNTDSNTDHFYHQSYAEQTNFNYLNSVERQLRAFWSEYVQYQEKHGFNENTKALKEKYFNLYRSYRNDRNWKKIINNN